MEAEPTKPDAETKSHRRTRYALLILASIIVVGGIAAFGLSLDDKRRVTRLTGPLVITGAQGKVIRNVEITSTDGPCIVIETSQDVTIRDSKIGPCGGHGVEIKDSSGVRLLDNYIHPEFPVNTCCDKANGVFAVSSERILIQGNVVAYGETNVELLGVRDIQVIGNFLLNPLGPFPRGTQVQVWGLPGERSSDILIDSNYALSSSDKFYAFPEGQTDAINFGSTDRAVVRNNYITGGRHKAGCGLLADESANSMQFLNNTLVDVGGCGIGISNGTNQVVDGNRIYTHGLDNAASGNVALYVWKQYQGACGPVQVTNNIAVLIKPNGTFSSWWKGSGCDTTALSGNVFDQAAIDLLSPVGTKFPAPLIPPKQFARRLATPFSSGD